MTPEMAQAGYSLMKQVDELTGVLNDLDKLKIEVINNAMDSWGRKVGRYKCDSEAVRTAVRKEIESKLNALKEEFVNL